MPSTVLFIVGPTGSGKSDAALLLAKKIGGEIVSCDSMQMYRGLDIGTAKPTVRERKTVPHHLIDVIHPRKRSSVFQHRLLALQAIQKIIRRGKTPIVTGGSGFYIRSLLDGLPPSPGVVPKLRRRLEAEAKSPKKLYAKLVKIDPARARAIHPNDTKRVIRAIELFELAKRRPSEFKNGFRGLKAHGFNFQMFGLKRDRKELYGRIEKRVDQMFSNGWIDEVKRLKRTGFSRTAREAIGYKEILECLGGRKDLETVVSEIKKRTRHLAKKQLTWFRKDGRIHWISVRGNRFQAAAVRKILEQYAA